MIISIYVATDFPPAVCASLWRKAETALRELGPVSNSLRTDDLGNRSGLTLFLRRNKIKQEKIDENLEVNFLNQAQICIKCPAENQQKDSLRITQKNPQVGHSGAAWADRHLQSH